MEAFFVHLLKSSCILLLFLGIYQVFLKKETFFTGNRLFLAIGLLASVVLPFISITKTIYVERAPLLTADMNSLIPMNTSTNSPIPFNWFSLLLLVYLLGVVYFSIRLLVQLCAIQRIKKNSTVDVVDSFYHVKTNNHISPFSFFKHIFYYPKQFAENELDTIIAHEKVHAKELHSVDILFTELICLLQWFNPAIWWYKISIKQNLEFLADSQTCDQYQDKKQYQYLMLKQAVGRHKIAIANPFFNSLIKKRIVMLNQNQSKRINALKPLIVLPLLVLFLVGFNTKEEVKFTVNEKAQHIEITEDVKFISPLNQSDIMKVSSGFGPAKSPYTNEMEFHNGIDLVASSGKDVMASSDGIVKESSINNNNGNYVFIAHDNEYVTKYLHLKDRSVKVGDKVVAGDNVGHVGNTGKSTGPHLHFEILKSGASINPQSLIPFNANPKTSKSKKEVKNKNLKAYKTIELVITKDTSDDELEKMKKDLAKNSIDFSYTVVHNSNNEIIDITLNISGKSSSGENFSGNYNSSSENPIKPIYIVYNDEANSVSFGNATGKKIHIIKGTDGETNVWSGTDEIGEHEDIIIKHGKGNKSVWVSRDTDDIETIEVKMIDGIKKVFIDGKEVAENNLHENHFSFTTDDEDHDVRVKVISSKKKKKRKMSKAKKSDKNVFIIRDHDDDDATIEIINEDKGFVFIDTNEKEKPIFFIDGKKASEKEFKKLSPDEIATIDVSKGKAATKKYGSKAKNGVVEIVTKKEK